MLLRVRSHTTQNSRSHGGPRAPGCLLQRTSARSITRLQAVAPPRTAVPAFVPHEVADINDDDAQSLVSRLRRVSVSVPSIRDGPISTAFAGPSAAELASWLASSPPGAPAVILLHSFDSSCLEFRRLHPLLSEQLPTFALDLVRYQQVNIEHHGGVP